MLTRWKPERDPLYAGTLKIPAGGIHSTIASTAFHAQRGMLP